jgi:hypothetical protein
MFDLVPTTKWLLRLDGIETAGGDTSPGAHSHPGSGIRCLLSGEWHVRSEQGEESDNVAPGDCWYEEGSYPIYGRDKIVKPAKTLRCMILPPEFETNPDTAIWIEAHVKPKHKSDWRKYVNKVVYLR